MSGHKVNMLIIISIAVSTEEGELWVWLNKCPWKQINKYGKKKEPGSEVNSLSKESARESGAFMRWDVMVSITVHHVYLTYGNQCPEPMKRKLRKELGRFLEVWWCLGEHTSLPVWSSHWVKEGKEKVIHVSINCIEVLFHQLCFTIF